MMADVVRLSVTEKIDALDQLMASDGWGLVRERLGLQLLRDLADLERDTVGPEQTIKLRAQIARMRMLADLPQIMRDEFKRESPK